MTADQHELEIRLRDAKLAALAEFAAGAGHEINNPVATILGRAQQLLASETDPNRRRALATIAAQALRIRDMIGDLMLFARPPAPEPVRIDLASVVREAVAPLADQATERGVSLLVEADNSVVVFADPTHIAVAVTALIENALDAVGREGRVTVSASGRDGPPVLTVLDDGCGFSDADREHAFDPFYSGRQAGRGLGFGLPKAWRIVTLAGGSIGIESHPGRTLVSVTFPRPESIPTSVPLSSGERGQG